MNNTQLDPTTVEHWGIANRLSIQVELTPEWQKFVESWMDWCDILCCPRNYNNLAMAMRLHHPTAYEGWAPYLDLARMGQQWYYELHDPKTQDFLAQAKTWGWELRYLPPTRHLPSLWEFKRGEDTCHVIHLATARTYIGA